MNPINIRVSRHSAFYSPLISTITGGFLAREGLTASYSLATPERGVPAGIRDGSVDVGQLAVSSSWGAMESGRPNDLMHFAQINERDGFFIAARHPVGAFEWSQLVGKTVLVDHLEQPLAMFKYALSRVGVGWDSLKVADAGDVAAIDKAFRDGTGDYVHQQGPAPQQLEKEGVARVVASVGEVVGPVAFSSLVASRKWLESDVAIAFMRAYRAARRYVNDTPAAKIAQAEAPYFEGIDPDVLTATIARYQGLGCWNPDPRITQEAYAAALEVFLYAGLITRPHPYHEVVVAPPDGA